MNIYISSGGVENASVFINIKRKLSKDKISMTAFLRPEVFRDGWHNASQAVKLKPMANRRFDSITDRWLSQAQPEAPVSRSVSEEAELTFRVISKSLNTGNKEVSCLSLVLVNRKKTFKTWRVTGYMAEETLNGEKPWIPGPRKKIFFKRTDLRRARVTLKWPHKRMLGRACEVKSWWWIAWLQGQNRTW